MLEYLPDPYPGELLYSVWARYSDYVRYANKMDVFLELFGTTGIQATVDLPSHLGYFVGNLPFGHTYTVDYFIDRHTLLPFYAAFHVPEQVRQLREQMISPNGQALHRKAGVSQTTIPSPHWLRYCPQCIQTDRENVGECYWHRLHQVPGVEICQVHRIWLENSAVRARNKFTTREFISAECASVATAARDAESSPFFQTLMNIAIDVFYLLSVLCGRGSSRTVEGDGVSLFKLPEEEL
jgi:TniQ